VGKFLGRAVESYNKATSSLENRLLVSARKLKELGAGENNIAVPEQIELRPRTVQEKRDGKKEV